MTGPVGPPLAAAVAWLPVLVAALAARSATASGQATRVRTAEVTTGRLERRVRQAMTLYPYEKVQVYARATGYASEVRADIGDEVTQGQTLVVLDIPEQEADLRAREAELAVADARLDKARAEHELEEAELELTKNLFEKGGRDRFQLERALADEARARAEVAFAEASRARAVAGKKRVSALAAYGQVRAPFDGIVTRRLVDTGDLVREGTASETAPLFEVERVDRLRCRVEVPESDAPFVLASLRAETLSTTIRLDALPETAIRLGAEELARGRARFAGSVHPQSHHMRGEIVLENSDGRYLPGAFGRITLEGHGTARRNVPLVPNEAVQAPPDEPPFVYVVETKDGASRAVRRQVALGTTDGTSSEVRSGLQGGERVVVRAAGGLTDGQAVLAVPSSASSEASQ